MHTNESVVAAARDSTGLATVYRALDELVDLYALADAAVVVDVPGFGRQVLPRRTAPAARRRAGAARGRARPLPRSPARRPGALAAHAGARHPRPAPRRGGHVPVVSIVSLDELELQLRRLTGVRRGRIRGDRRPRAGRGAGRRPTRTTTSPATPPCSPPSTCGGRSRSRSCGGVTVVPHQPEARLRLVDVATDAGVGEVTVRLARGEEEALGRASTAAGCRPRSRRRSSRSAGSCPSSPTSRAGPAPSRPPRPAVPGGRVGHRPDHPHPPPRRRRGRHAHRGRRPRHPRRAQPHHQPRVERPHREVASLKRVITRPGDATSFGQAGSRSSLKP